MLTEQVDSCGGRRLRSFQGYRKASPQFRVPAEAPPAGKSQCGVCFSLPRSDVGKLELISHKQDKLEPFLRSFHASLLITSGSFPDPKLIFQLGPFRLCVGTELNRTGPNWAEKCFQTLIGPSRAASAFMPSEANRTLGCALLLPTHERDFARHASVLHPGRSTRDMSGWGWVGVGGTTCQIKPVTSYSSMSSQVKRWRPHDRCSA